MVHQRSGHLVSSSSLCQRLPHQQGLGLPQAATTKTQAFWDAKLTGSMARNDASLMPHKEAKPGFHSQTVVQDVSTGSLNDLGSFPTAGKQHLDPQLVEAS